MPRIAKRALIILKNADELTPDELVKLNNKVDKKTESLWCQRFRDHGCDCILRDSPRLGRRRRNGGLSLDEVIDTILQKEPPNRVRWSIRDLATELEVPQSTLHRFIKLHQLSHSRDDLMMKIFNQSRYTISTIAGLFLSPTLKAIAFQYELGPRIGDDISLEKRWNNTQYDYLGKENTLCGAQSMAHFTIHPNIYIFMARTDMPGKLTQIQIPGTCLSSHTSESNGDSSSIIEITPQGTAFFYYKGEELHRAIEAISHEMASWKCDRSYVKDLLIFLDHIDTIVRPGKELSLVLNSMVMDTEDRISCWLGRHPRFRPSSFSTDELWLGVAVNHINNIGDRFKQLATCQLEYFLKCLVEYNDTLQQQSRPFISYMRH